MQTLSEFDWLNSSNEARKVLYQVLKPLIQSGRLSYKKLFAEAFAGQSLGKDYERNIEKGTLSRKKALQLATYLDEHFPSEAKHRASDLIAFMPITSDGDWAKLLDEHGQFDTIRLLTFAEGGSLSIVGFAETEPVAGTKIKLGQGFCFQLDSTIAGKCLAFQFQQGSWHPMPLTMDRTLQAIQHCEQVLPRDEDGNPVKLWEPEIKGLAKFVFVVTTDDMLVDANAGFSRRPVMPPKDLDQFASELMSLETEFALHRVNVLFVD